MTIPSPISNPEAWDTLTIGGLSFSGGFEFSGEVLKRKLDHRHSAGRDGARIRDRGYDLAEIKLSLRCYQTLHFEQLGALVALLFPRGADPAQRAAYACAHPALAIAGITEVYAKVMDTLHQTSPGLWETTIDLVEYRAAANRTVAHRVTQRPSIAASNPTAFTGTEAAPPTPPSAAPSSAGLGPQPD